MTTTSAAIPNLPGGMCVACGQNKCSCAMPIWLGVSMDQGNLGQTNESVNQSPVRAENEQWEAVAQSIAHMRRLSVEGMGVSDRETAAQALEMLGFKTLHGVSGSMYELRRRVGRLPVVAAISDHGESVVIAAVCRCPKGLVEWADPTDGKVHVADDNEFFSRWFTIRDGKASVGEYLFALPD